MAKKSSLIDNPELTLSPILPSEWTTAGTARSRFAEASVDGSLKKQIVAPALTESLQRLRQQFAEIQLGSEYFFQALDFLRWGDANHTNESEATNLCFHVRLSGLLLMRKAAISGSTCLPWTELQTQISSMLLKSGFSVTENSPDEWQNWLLTVCGTGSESDVLCFEKTIITENNSLLYFNKNWLRECQLLSLMWKRLNMQVVVPEKSVVENVLGNVLEENPVRFGKQPLKLAEKQKEAVLLAISSPFMIVSGGPGTGKTSVAVTMLRVLKQLGLAERPALAAPTGRAAKRMSESVVNSLRSLENTEQLLPDQELLEVAAEAKTLHRLLGYFPDERSFRHHEYNPLEHDLLIIDEGSMIDQELMIYLLRAANSELPHRTSVPRIILLGDAQQLPPVGNGAVLMELTQDLGGPDQEDAVDNPVPVVSLVRSYRQKIADPAGRNILGVAETVKNIGHDPRPELLFEAKSPNQEIIQRLNSLEEVELEKVLLLNQVNSLDQIKVFAKWWVEQFLQDENFLLLTQQEYPFDAAESCASQLDYLFNHLKNFHVLTATQVLSTGAEKLNQKIRECWLAENGANQIFSEHYPGEPVIVTENNYMYRLFNGDQGIFLKFLNPDTNEMELKAVFPVEGVFKTFYEHELHHLYPAYATTVHKSQGSEYNHLALILPTLSIDSGKAELETRRVRELMSREMLYTALTRAVKSVLIIGEQSVLESAALHKVSRYSGLGTSLRSKRINRSKSVKNMKIKSKKN